ncbi:MAG: flagellar biosynthetic protein FliR [Syntrophobacterales bacterium]|jgi:flagellar biosynthetic protein FliR|nr:flagellar biosynthetic protein FliR [Syntrophobacterales bacterium]
MPNITLEQAQLFILIFLRVSTIIVLVPILGDASVPVRVKGGLSILITSLLFPFVKLDASALGFDVATLFLRMAGEVMVGAVIGFTVRLVFAGIQLAGQLVGFQMGFAIVNVIDPANSAQVSIIAEFLYLVAALLFLSLNGHHVFIGAIAESFRLAPPTGLHLTGPVLQGLMTFMKDMFELALKIGAPVIAMMFFMSVGLGLVARTVPQINVFIVGFPLQIAVGLIGIGLAMPFFVTIAGRCFGSLERSIHGLLRLMSV